MLQLPEDKTLIINMLKGTVPERQLEIGELWNTHAPAVTFVLSKPGATMQADSKQIEFDPKLIDVFWILGFAAWKAIEVFTPLVVLGPLLGLSLDDMLDRDVRLSEGERDFKELVGLAKRWIDEGLNKDFWPDAVPRLTGNREALASPEQKAIYDLVLMALSFCWLHEFRHVMFRQTKAPPLSKPVEELACDAWARGFMVDNLVAYAKAENLSYESVLAKRMTAIAIAIFIIGLLSPAHAVFGHADYPFMGDRIATLMAAPGLSPESDFWTFAACILIAIRRLDHQSLGVVPKDRKDLVEQLLGIMQSQSETS